jgi:lipopolysaccharide transport system permease protein
MNVVLPAPVRAAVPKGAHTLEFTPDQSFAQRQHMAVRDLRGAWELARLCWTLSWLDIKLRYRGSMLGPFWLTLSTAVMVGALGFMNSALFNTPVASYLPFLALSLVLWAFLSTLVSEGCTCFTSSDGMIRSIRMPFSIYGGRVVLRNLLVLAHNIFVIVVIDVALGTWPDATGFLAVPAFALWCVDGLAVSLLFGAFCARFRDIPPIVASVMQMAFFVSAVIYKPEQMGEHEWLLPFNPFFSLLEIVRGPLLSQVPSTATYVSALLYSVVICGASWLLFVRVRGRIAFWV